MEKFIATIEFKDIEDLNAFLQYARRAKESEGTVTGVYCGVMCSALKRAKTTGSIETTLGALEKDGMI